MAESNEEGGGSGGPIMGLFEQKDPFEYHDVQEVADEVARRGGSFRIDSAKWGRRLGDEGRSRLTDAGDAVLASMNWRGTGRIKDRECSPSGRVLPFSRYLYLLVLVAAVGLAGFFAYQRYHEYTQSRAEWAEIVGQADEGNLREALTAAGGYLRKKQASTYPINGLSKKDAQVGAWREGLYEQSAEATWGRVQSELDAEESRAVRHRRLHGFVRNHQHPEFDHPALTDARDQIDQTTFGRIQTDAPSWSGRPCEGPVHIDGEQAGQNPLSVDYETGPFSIEIDCHDGVDVQRDLALSYGEFQLVRDEQ